MLLSSGCTPTNTALITKPQDMVMINGARYISALALAKQQNLEYFEDPIASKVVLSKGSKEARLMAGSYIALFNNQVRNLEKEVKYYQGSFVIPQTFAYKSLAPYFKGEEGYIAKKEEALLPPEKLEMMPLRRVIIDPGHGGKDPGAVGKGGLKEKDVVLEIGKYLKKQLEATGISAIMTRDTDRFIPLDERARIANAQNADFFVSIHANASRSKWVSGVEVFYISESVDDGVRSKKSAKNYDPSGVAEAAGSSTETIVWDLIHSDNRVSAKEMADYVCRSLSRNLAQKNRGTKQARFYVLNGTNIPAILIEVGFISNPVEEKKLLESDYRGKIAQAVTDGMIQYNRTYGQELSSR